MEGCDDDRRDCPFFDGMELLDGRMSLEGFIRGCRGWMKGKTRQDAPDDCFFTLRGPLIFTKGHGKLLTMS